MRGSVFDAIYLIGWFFVLIIIAFVVVNVSSDVTTACTDFTTNGLGNNANITGMCPQINQYAANYASTIPYIIGAAGLGAIILASQLGVNPVFLPIGIILLLVAVYLGLNVQGALAEVLASPYFATPALAYPLITQLASNLGWIIFIVGAAILVVMYGLGRYVSGRGGNPEG